MYDVAVVGAGPAGAATAITLRRHGVSVALIDREAEPRPRIGESLPGAARKALRDLGVLAAVDAAPHRPDLGVLSCWGAAELVVRDAFLDPHGLGWRLDRAAFEAMLRARAAEAGAAPLFGAPVTHVRRLGVGAGWELALRDRPAIQARFLVASGRQARIARLAGAQLAAHDQLVCRYVRLPPRDAPGRLDGFHLVEAAAEGWWYVAALPDGRRIVAFHTDRDLLAARLSRTADGFAELLGRTSYAAEFAGWRPGMAAPTIASESARSQVLEPVRGADWAAVGDAAIGFDPLSSYGLLHALEGGLRIGKAVASHLAGGCADLEAHRERTARIAQDYAADKAAYYAMEPRFRGEPFWARRVARRPS
jgi:flavin-dependent dehydrogenase